MSKAPVASYPVKKVQSSNYTDTDDALAVEEPLEIRIIFGPASDRKMKNISVTMRTPGSDFELAAGFLFTEGIISGPADILEIFNNPEDCTNRQENIVIVALKEDIAIDIQQLERHFYTTSSCGVCGKASINAIRTITERGNESEDEKDTLKFLYNELYQLPELLRAQQDVFESTGGLHASALFDLSFNLLIIREDVGRHNALDKLIGACLMEGMLPLSEHILLLSGRASFELIQKAAVAGIKIVLAVGAPSSLAVQLAQEFDITLIGFLRKERFNIYSGMQRIIF